MSEFLKVGGKSVTYFLNLEAIAYCEFFKLKHLPPDGGPCEHLFIYWNKRPRDADDGDLMLVGELAIEVYRYLEAQAKTTCKWINETNGT